MTARAALGALAQRGMVERDVGRGTFVSPTKLRHDLRRFAGFTETARREGLAPDAQVRSLEQIPAPDAVAGALKIDPGDAVYRVQRLRLADAAPLALEDSWIPARRFPGLLDHEMRGSLYALMRDAYGLEPVRAIEHLEPALADAARADTLGIEPGAPLMLITRIAFAAGDVPVEFARDHHRGDRVRFIVEASTAIPDARRPQGDRESDQRANAAIEVASDSAAGRSASRLRSTRMSSSSSGSPRAGSSTLASNTSTRSVE
jgi:GntR family transcriptional regulator